MPERECISRINFEAADTNENSDIWNVDDWQRNGDAELHIVEDPETRGTSQYNRALSVRRTNSWDGISGKPGLFEPQGTYAFAMKARLGEDAPPQADVRFELTNGTDFEWVGNTPVTANEWTPITGIHTFGGDGQNFRPYTASEDVPGHGPYEVLLDDLTIHRILPGDPDYPSDAGGTATAPSGTVVARLDFANRNLVDDQGHQWATAGLAGYDFTSDPENPANTVLTYHQDGDWQGLQTPVGLLENGVDYEVITRVRWADGHSGQMRQVSSDGGNAGWNWVVNTDVNDAEWTNLHGSFSVSGFETPIVRINAGAPGTVLVDEVSVIRHD